MDLMVEVACRACGTVLPAWARYCRRCGQRQPGDVRAPADVAAGAQHAENWPCPACASFLPAGARYCWDCGHPLAPAQGTDQARKTTALDAAALGALSAIEQPGAPPVPVAPAGPQVGVPGVPHVPAGPQSGAPSVPSVLAGPQTGIPSVPSAPAGPQMGAPGVPHVPAASTPPHPPDLSAGPITQKKLHRLHRPGKGQHASGSAHAEPGGPGVGPSGSMPVPTGMPLPARPIDLSGGPSSGTLPKSSKKGSAPSASGVRLITVPRVIVALLSLLVLLSVSIGAFLLVHVRLQAAPVLPSLHPARFAQSCQSLTDVLPPVSTTLDNTGGTTAVDWRVSILDNDPQSLPWAAPSLSQGTVAAGRRASLTFAPASALCQDMRHVRVPLSYRVALHVGQGMLLLTDTISPPPVIGFAGQPILVQQACAGTAPLPTVSLALDNSDGNATVDWQVKISDTDPAGQVWATASPTSGTVAAGQSGTLMLTPTSLLCQDLSAALAPITYHATLSYQAPGNTGQVAVSDQVTPPQVVKLSVSPTSFSQVCPTSQSQLGGLVVTLDNTGSNVPVNWQVQVNGTDPKGRAWATVSASSGTVPAGQQGSLTISPISALCADMQGGAANTYRAMLSYGAPGSSTTNQMTIDDAVSPPPPVVRFSVSPTSFSQMCPASQGQLGGVRVTLDNSGSSVPVAWQVSITQTDPAGHVWSTASPSSGTVAAGQQGSVTLNPITSLCQDMQGGATITYGATLHYSAQGATNQMTVIDQVTPQGAPPPPPPPTVNVVVSPTSFSQACAANLGQLGALTLTLDNSGSTIAVDWQVSITQTDPAGQVWATASAVGGTVPAGQQASLALSPISALCRDLLGGGSALTYSATVSYSAQASTGQVTISDQVAPPPPTVTFSASPTSFSQACPASVGQLSGLGVTLDNSGSNVPVNWQISITQTDPKGNIWAAASAANGTVGAGQKGSVTISPISALCSDMLSSSTITYRATLSYSSAGGSGQVLVSDQVAPPVVFHFGASPTSFSQTCTASSTQLGGLTVMLDNSGSNVPVTWQISITQTDPKGTVWATANPGSGPLAAGQQGTLTINPITLLCQDVLGVVSPITYSATLSYSSAGGSGQTTISDQVTPPPVVNFVVSPTSFSQSCTTNPGQLSNLSVTLDNSRSTVPVNWQVSAVGNDPNGYPWASASPTMGTVLAGQQASLTISPNNPTLCQEMLNGSVTTYTVTLSYSSSVGSGQVTASDTVSPAIFNLTPAPMNYSQTCPSPQSQLAGQTVTLDNTGSNFPVNWQVGGIKTDPAGNAWATASPSSGTVPAGQKMALTLTPISSLCKDMLGGSSAIIYYVDINITWPGGNLSVNDTVTPPPTVNFIVTPTNPMQSCPITPALSITLDNMGSNVSVAWQVSMTQTDPAGQVWASASPTSGTVPASQKATLTITPIPNLCSDISHTTHATFNGQASLTYTPAGATSQTLTITDTVLCDC